MTDTEIIKAFEMCNYKNSCKGCPLEGSSKYCFTDVDSGILDLIKRQQAEIERLEHIRAELSRDVERLWKDCDFFEDKATNGVKEFQNKIVEQLEESAMCEVLSPADCVWNNAVRVCIDIVKEGGKDVTTRNDTGMD